MYITVLTFLPQMLVESYLSAKYKLNFNWRRNIFEVMMSESGPGQ